MKFIFQDVLISRCSIEFSIHKSAIFKITMRFKGFPTHYRIQKIVILRQFVVVIESLIGYQQNFRKISIFITSLTWKVSYMSL